MAIERVTELGVERTALRRRLEEITPLLQAAVVEATALQEDSEHAIAKAAGVDRMTVRKWTGKAGQWGGGR